MFHPMGIRYHKQKSQIKDLALNNLLLLFTSFHHNCSICTFVWKKRSTLKICQLFCVVIKKKKNLFNPLHVLILKTPSWFYTEFRKLTFFSLHQMAQHMWCVLKLLKAKYQKQWYVTGDLWHNGVLYVQFNCHAWNWTFWVLYKINERILKNVPP